MGRRAPTGKRKSAVSYEVTKELCDKVESLAAQGLTLEQICSCIGWCFATLAKKKRANIELVHAIKRGQDKGIAQVTNALFKNAKGGNLGAQCFYLKNRDRENWKDQQDHNVSGGVELVRKKYFDGSTEDS